MTEMKETPVKKFLLSLTLILVTTALAYAHSALNRFWGEVPVDMLLSGDVLVVKTLVVPEGVTLTIEPGTVVRFEKSRDGGNRIIVKGRLMSVGTKDKPIRFIPKDGKSGPWFGVEFQGGGTGRVERCSFEGASAGIVDPAKKASVKDSTFR